MTTGNQPKRVGGQRSQAVPLNRKARNTTAIRHLGQDVRRNTKSLEGAGKILGQLQFEIDVCKRLLSEMGVTSQQWQAGHKAVMTAYAEEAAAVQERAKEAAAIPAADLGGGGGEREQKTGT